MAFFNIHPLILEYKSEMSAVYANASWVVDGVGGGISPQIPRRACSSPEPPHLAPRIDQLVTGVPGTF